jgi:hypothetical protein
VVSKILLPLLPLLLVQLLIHSLMQQHPLWSSLQQQWWTPVLLLPQLSVMLLTVRVWQLMLTSPGKRQQMQS